MKKRIQFKQDLLAKFQANYERKKALSFWRALNRERRRNNHNLKKATQRVEHVRLNFFYETWVAFHKRTKLANMLYRNITNHFNQKNCMEAFKLLKRQTIIEQVAIL